MKNKYLSLLGILLLILFLSNCGSDMQQTESGGEGSVTFGLEMQDTSTVGSILKIEPTDISQLPRYAVTCSSTIYTIEATIYNSSNSSIASGSWGCSVHSGSITSVPAGSNYKIVVLGKDTSGNITYRGETTGITVTAGQSTNAGTITINSFIPTLSSSSGSTLSSGSNLSLSWSGSSSGSTYQIQISTSSSFSSLAVEATSSSSLSLSAGTYYWRIRAIDSNGNKSDWPSAKSFTVSSSVTGTITISSTTATITTSSPADTIIVTDTTWKASGTSQTGWTSTSFNDSAWSSAVSETNFDGTSSTEQWGSATNHITGTSAKYIWTEASYWNTSNAYLRKTFTISTVPSSAVVSIFADDDYKLYINGTLVATDNDETWVSNPTSTQYSVAQYLVSGQNVIAIQGMNSTGPACVLAELNLNSTTADTTAPSSPSVSINSGATSTTSTSVTLTLSATDNVGVTGYYASETSTTPSASASGWTSVTSTTSYSGSVSFTLSSGSGTKTVYVWFKDAAGNVSAAASDDIIYSSITNLMGGSIQGTALNLTSSNATVITFAGSASSSGSTDGTGTSARFKNTEGITTDGTNLFVTEEGNHTIRKVVISTGVVTTIAGSAGSSLVTHHCSLYYGGRYRI